MPTALEQAGALRRGQHEARSMSDNNQPESLDRYNNGQRVGVEDFNSGPADAAAMAGDAGASKHGEKKQPEKNGGNIREQQAQARKQKQNAVLDKYTGGMGANSVKDLLRDAYNGDVFEVAGAIITNPVAMKWVWSTVIPSFGLTIFVLDFIFLYDSFHEKRLPMWQQMAIALVTLVYFTLIAIIIAANYEYYSLYVKLGMAIARSLGIIE